MTAALALSTAAKKARLVRAFLGGEPVHCTWQLSPRCESFCPVTVEAAFPLPLLDGHAAAVVARLRELRRRHPHLRSSGRALEDMGRAVTGGVPGCLAGRAFFNVDHRGRATKCIEFRGVADRVGALPVDAAEAVRSRLRAVQTANGCQACWYASRAEVESLYTVRGFLAGLRILVTA